jgi:hypothetical protein
MKTFILFIILLSPFIAHADLMDDALEVFIDVAEDDIEFVQQFGNEQSGFVLCVWLRNGSVLTKTVKKGYFEYIGESGGGYGGPSRIFLLFDEIQRLCNIPHWQVRGQIDGRAYFKEESRLLSAYEAIIYHRGLKDFREEAIEAVRTGIMESAHRGASGLVLEVIAFSKIGGDAEELEKQIKLVDPDIRVKRDV